MLRAQSHHFLPHLRALFGGEEDPVVELDCAWAGIVLQNVPGDALREAGDLSQFSQEVARANGIMLEEIKDVRVLCREEDLKSKTSVSVRLMLSSVQTAAQLLQRGAFAYSAFCRVVPYRTKIQTRRTPQSPSPPGAEAA
jgi:hypothetical protein